MPNRMSRISRRQFLAQSFAASFGLGLALTPTLHAASRKTDPDSWALLSDTHISADAARVYHEVNLAGNLSTVVRAILALKENPAGVIISGDLAVNHGEPGDYATFTSLLQPLRQAKIPIHLALGNHDHREHFRQALREAGASSGAVAEKQVALVRSPHANWFMLDSLLTSPATPGRLGDAQRSWLAKTLDANPDKPAILVMHHNPGRRDQIGSLEDTQELLDIIRPRKQVKAWIYGHSHVWGVKPDESGIHLINLPPVAYTFSKTDPNGWVHARLEREGIRLELRTLNPTHSQQGETLELKWRVAA
jgi:3',5'-cyclic-AMP phosphodiesterase